MRGVRRWTALVCVVTLVATACGSRLTTEEIRSRSTESSGGPSATAGDALAGDDGDDKAGATAGPTGDPAVASSSRRAGKQGTRTGGGAAFATSGGTKAPIVVGLVGSFSGIAGPPSRPVADVWVAWSKAVNARGGINGHRVQLLVGDDGTSAARSISIAQDFVETKGAIALSYMGPDTVSFANWAKSKRIPVIGGPPGDTVWNTNPMMFPPSAGVDAGAWAQARAMKDAGARSIGVVWCAESPICKASADRVAAQARAIGLRVVYQGQVSLAAPDYTAECLQMKSSGAEAVSTATTNDAALRIAASCARQSYRPRWTTSAADDRMARSKHFEGAIGAPQAFPWFLRSGAPGIDEYVDALTKYAPHRLTDGNSLQATGWASAKILELAAQNVGDEPTTQDILDGLWSIKGATLGGLAPGGAARTYTRDQPTPDTYCAFTARVQGGKWVGSLIPVCR
jgi:branched-chain amino acid transport system substrate-binding protein